MKAKIDPNKRREQKLRKASEHLLYELNMLSSLTRILTSGAFSKGAINNAFIESFAVHARILIYFLYAENPRNEEVVAYKYFSKREEWEKKTIRPNLSKILRDTDKRANVQVAHLSFDRQKVTPEQKEWHFIAIYKEIMEVMYKFVEVVRDDLIVPGLKRLMQEWKKANGPTTYCS